MEKHECWDCEKEFEFDWDDTYETCDTIEGQYTVFTTISCPYCGIENRWQIITSKLTRTKKLAL